MVAVKPFSGLRRTRPNPPPNRPMSSSTSMLPSRVRFVDTPAALPAGRGDIAPAAAPPVVDDASLGREQSVESVMEIPTAGMYIPSEAFRALPVVNRVSSLRGA